MTLLVANSSCNLATNNNPGGMGWANRYWLGPSKWDYHKPWFWSLGDGLEDQQFVKDAEIQQAYRCGIDCFVYQHFPQCEPRPSVYAAFSKPHGDIFDGANQDFMLHLSSPYKNLVPFCISLGGSGGDWATQVAYLVSLMLMPCYQKILGNRPLIFMLFPEDLFQGYAGRTLAQAVADLSTLRSAVTGAGLGNPFIIGQDISPTGTPNLSNMGALGLNSASLYCLFGNASPETYASFAAREEAAWDTYRTNWNFVVPTVTAGTDYRMQSDVNGLAGSYSPPGAGEALSGPWTEIPTPTEFSNHLKNAFAWDPAHNFAGIVHIYSWSEPTECARPLRPLWSDAANNGSGNFLQLAIAQALGRQNESKRALRSRGIAITTR